MQQRYPERRVRGVQECIEVLKLARSGKMTVCATTAKFSRLPGRSGRTGRRPPAGP